MAISEQDVNTLISRMKAEFGNAVTLGQVVDSGRTGYLPPKVANKRIAAIENDDYVMYNIGPISPRDQFCAANAWIGNAQYAGFIVESTLAVAATYQAYLSDTEESTNPQRFFPVGIPQSLPAGARIFVPIFFNDAGWLPFMGIYLTANPAQASGGVSAYAWIQKRRGPAAS